MESDHIFMFIDSARGAWTAFPTNMAAKQVAEAAVRTLVAQSQQKWLTNSSNDHGP